VGGCSKQRALQRVVQGGQQSPGELLMVLGEEVRRRKRREGRPRSGMRTSLRSTLSVAGFARAEHCRRCKEVTAR